MDLETENRLAAMLMREAAELRRQSEQEGVLAYLHKPNVRTRPNSRFLTATVRGVQQANRAVEVNEMWRVRQKELELDKQAKGTTKDKSSGYKSHTDRDSSGSPRRYAAFDNSLNASSSCSSKRKWDKCGSKDKGSSDKHYKDISNNDPSRSMSRHGNFQEPEYNPEPEGKSEAEVASVPEWMRLGLTFRLIQIGKLVLHRMQGSTVLFMVLRGRHQGSRMNLQKRSFTIKG
ncbi:uncharacterized protein LOC107612841 isoform X3 [Arachis ipaensis]|uniref:uncharacterized protein LOC107612841 isoform X3 n=1 Tax=Arachis ipaensis TaxID=130454 RepID=UPI000A2B5BEC|nr:uncharacterized protein LOC107612841 isoform X3 [Arachis ipaensis]XP_029151100.1 uncharacterized protein LOC112772455 isoform X2 [Arachis hypogaea]